MALIDKETIRAEIERRKIAYRSSANLQDAIRYDEITDLIAFLDTLPEQPAGWEDENAADKKAVKEIVKTVHKEVIRQVKEMVKEQSASEGLEEEMDEIWLEYCEDVDYLVYASIARHFAEWGAEHMKK